MKKLSGIIAILILLTFNSFAIEGLQISVQSSNAVLSWPSVDDGSETYLVQSRNTLGATDSWATLTDNLNADSGTNITHFVDPNSVPYPPLIAGNTNAGSIDPNGTNSSTGTNTFSSTTGFYCVVRDGAHLFGLTNGMILSGMVSLPVELANGSGTVSTLSLTEDDSPVGNSIQTAPLTVPLALTVDTTLMSNGVHQVSASARWDDTNGGFWEAVSPAVSVTVSNEISFPNWMPEFGELGNTLLIRATSAHTNADWQIDVYDSQYLYVGSFTGHTDDGDISVVWNLVDYNGVAHTNDNFFISVVSTTFDDPQTAQAISPPTHKKLEQWLGPGAWVAVALHGWDNYLNSDLLYSELSGFIGGAKQVSWQVSPPATMDDLGNWDAYALHTDSQQDIDWQAFRNALYDPHSRNIVYFGHGGPNGLGYNPADTNSYISTAEIASVLHTIPVGQTNSHSFRFAFLDGCSTAEGTLPEAFGIFHRENVPGGDYEDASLRLSAFVGWPEKKTIAYGINGGLIDTFHVDFIGDIQIDMLLNGANIKDAIKYAAGQSDTGGEFNADSMKVYGFWGLTFGLDN